MTPVRIQVPWVSQYDPAVPGYGDTACYRACQRMAALAGVLVPDSTERRLQVANGEDAHGRVLTTPQQTASARAYLDVELEAGRPVVVGVSHQDSAYNRDKLTDHFVLVVGRGSDPDGRRWYEYHDPASSHEHVGVHRRFYVDQGTGNLVHDGVLAAGAVVARHTELSMVVYSHQQHRPQPTNQP